MGWVLAVCAAVTALAATAATARANTTIYRSTVEPRPGNLPSDGFEATSTSEFGDEVTFAHHARRLKTVTVTMSSWGCQVGSWNLNNCSTHPGAKFSVPITLRLYPAPAGTTPGSPFLSVTKTFRIPYRPSASPKCTGPFAGEWFLKHHGCFNGKAANITFNLSSLHLHLPNTLVWSVAYNTTHYGYSPIGESAACFTSPGGCPYDSLNVGLGPSVKVGSKPDPDTVFQSTTWAGALCDGTPTLGVFNLDSPTSACWAGYVPAAKFVAGS
jgi:hypothetical protein